MLKVSYSSSRTGDFKELQDPKDFVVLGANGELPNSVNRLKCEARNADVIYWEYKEREKDEWSRTLPPPIPDPEASKGGERISLTIDDGDTTRLEDVAKLNGFYRCNVKNSVTGYQTQAPPIRLIIACK